MTSYYPDDEADQIYVTEQISIEAYKDGEGVSFVNLMPDETDVPYLSPIEAINLANAILKRFQQ